MAYYFYSQTLDTPTQVRADLKTCLLRTTTHYHDGRVSYGFTPMTLEKCNGMLQPLDKLRTRANELKDILLINEITCWITYYEGEKARLVNPNTPYVFPNNIV